MTEREAVAQELASIEAEAVRREGYKIRQFFPDAGVHRRELYAKHLAFFAAGATYPERLFMAANRVGKSEAGAFEVTCHLTGLYPDWWTGRRFTTPTHWWACGTNNETTRDIVQEKLLGPWELALEGAYTGMIPGHLVVGHVRRQHGLKGSLESITVTHVSGGISKLAFKTYEQGRSSFEGTAKHGIWCDEEPPEDCYTEMLYRTATTHGITLVTFTPLQGMSAVVMGFLQPTPEAAKYKHFTQAGWDDVPHLSETVKAALLATTPPFQRDARTKGTPQLGAGAIYAIPESEISVPPFAVPAHWPRGFGMDAGMATHPTAAAFGALDRENQTLYVTNVYRRESPELAVHVAALKARGADWMPGVGDCAGNIVTEHDSEQLIAAYRRAGLNLQLPDKAVETGIQDVWELMSAGRFKVFASCGEWFEEFRLYHRDEKGRIVKVRDDLMDATRYLVRSGVKRMIVKPIAKARPSSGHTSASQHGWMG